MKARTSLLSSILSAALVAGGMLSGTSVQAQEAAPASAVAGARIGFVNTDRLFSESKAAQDAQSRLKQEFASREKTLANLGQHVKQAFDQFEKQAPKLSDAERIDRQKQLVEMDSDFQQKRREFQEDLNNRKNEELQKLLDRANRVVIQIAKAEHYDVILQEAVYVDRRLDITDKVIAGLNATSGN
ncbi:MAG: OmpH family outer membrane protein [Brachymonas sp.]|mgnify:CR=1 FL=1|uniref:OmpH family outer membrane protein n=1 Tax=Brachymonas sp. TaxID=1936292 RepID=UPI0035AE0174